MLLQQRGLRPTRECPTFSLSILIVYRHLFALPLIALKGWRIGTHQKGCMNLTPTLSIKKEETMKRTLGALAFLILIAFPAWGQGRNRHKVGGELMTNVGSIPLGNPGPTNLGPVFGDLAGSVAAEYVGNFTFQHYWVTASGETIKLKPATLSAANEDQLDGGTVVAVRWGHYKSE